MAEGRETFNPSEHIKQEGEAQANLGSLRQKLVNKLYSTKQITIDEGNIAKAQATLHANP